MSATRPDLSKHRWQKLRARAKARDGHCCRRCGARAKLQVHHRVCPEDGGRDELANLETLCSRCHRLTHKAMAASRRQRFPGRGVVGTDYLSPHPLGVGNLSPGSGKNGSRPEDVSYEDDPEAGIFWGPKQPNGMMTRWSRQWFDWRNDPALAPARL
jgi:HNH endonuclease